MTALDQNTAVALLLEHINNLKIHMNDTESSNLPAIVKEWGAVSNLLVEVLKTNELYADYIDVTDLTADNAFIKYLEAAVAVVSHINADVIDVHSLYADTIKTKEFEAYKANINILLAEYIKATDIVADTITVNQLFGVCAQFFSLVSDSITAEDIVSFKVTSDHLTIKDAFIKDAMIDSITASKIIAGIIDTSKVQIKSKTGALIIADDTITIRDGESVRVQIGRDGDGNYNMYVCDTSGNVLWNALGLQADAIKSAIITDAMVSDTANINGTKIDIASVITEINSDSTMLNSSKISVDSDNQTLSAWFQTMNAWKSDTAEEVSTQSTQIEVLQGSVKTLLEDTRITELQGQYQSISSKYSALEQDVTGFKANVSSTYATKEALSNVDGKLASYSTTSQMNSAISQSASAVKSEVSESYYTKTSVDDKLSGYATQSYVGSAIIQNKDAITLEVASTYATKSDFDSLQIGGRNLALDSSKGWNTTAYNVIQGTLSENWIVGETYTVSLKGSTTDGYFRFYRAQGWGRCGDVKSIGNGIFRLTFICMEETHTETALNTFSIYHMGNDGATSIIDWIKIEKGSKNTDYSPAPEDVAYTKSIISTINQTAETIKISASKLELTGAVTFSMFDSTTQSKLNTTVKDVRVYYALSSSATTAPTSGWSTMAPAWVSGKYMWQKTTTTYYNGTSTDSAITCITGATGQTGATGGQGPQGPTGPTGATGVGVKAVKPQYYLSTSATTQSGGSWVDTCPTWSVGKYIWTRSYVTYTNNSVSTSTPVRDTQVEDNSILNWCYSNNKSYINGAKIYTGTVTANQISANAITADKISTNALKSRNYVANSTGSFLNLADGSFSSKNLSWDSIGNVSISGDITASKGKIKMMYPVEKTIVDVLKLDDGGTRASLSINFSDAMYISMETRMQLVSKKIDFYSESITMKDVPIVDYGTNANGVYIKFYNGAMICAKNVTYTGSLSNSWGSMKESPAVNLGNWSSAFVSNPYIMIQPIGSGSGGSTIPEGVTGYSTTAVGITWLLAPVPKSGTFYIDVIGIGRWK